MTAYSAVGSSQTWWGRINSDGVLKGTTGTISAGSGAGMGRLEGVNSVSLPVPDARAVPIPGDNSQKGTIMIPSDSAIEGSISTSIRDLTFTTTTQGGLVETLGNTNMILLGSSCPDFVDSLIIVNSPALVQTAGNKGVKGWSTLAYLNVQVQGKPPESLDNGTALDFPHRLVGKIVDQFFWGTDVAPADWGHSDGLVLDMGVGSYPWTSHSFEGNNSATTVTLDETPAGANGNDVLVWKAGVALAYTTDYTVDTSTKVVTFVAAPASAADVVIVYRYIPSC
jgi:hypothetical protein